MLRLAGMTREQVTTVSRTVTLNILDMAHAQTWELLQNDHLADDTLADMQSGWERVDVLSSLPSLWRAERAAILPFFSSPHFGPFLYSIRYRMTGWPLDRNPSIRRLRNPSRFGHSMFSGHSSAAIRMRQHLRRLFRP